MRCASVVFRPHQLRIFSLNMFGAWCIADQRCAGCDERWGFNDAWGLLDLFAENS